MRLRICDGERERIALPSIEMVEQAFAPGAALRRGTEISLADGERWLTALPVGAPDGGVDDDAEKFLLLAGTGESAELTGPVGRREALRRFREFVQASGPSLMGGWICS
jgi:hypothetical protein